MIPFVLHKFLSNSHSQNQIPMGMRVYAIGDIHGCRDHLEQLLLKIDEDIALKADPTMPVVPKLVFLGDYVDRGSQSPEVIDFLINLQNSDRDTVFLMGNHERSLLKFLIEPEDNIDWLDWGGDQTLFSYGVKGVSARDPRDLAADLQAELPSAHLKFLQNLETRFELGDFIFVHAGLKPGVPLEEQRVHDQLWIRDEFHNCDKKMRPEQTIVHGHTSGKKVVDKGWRVCVDTGAVWSGVLTAVVLEANKRRFISTSPTK